MGFTKKKKKKEKKRKKALYFSVKVFSTKKLFCVVMRATRRSNRLQYKIINRVSSFLSYFKTMSIGRASGIEPATFPLCSQATAARLS